ncbi:unnamed protein product [Spodoptera exigua]|nr:unnamed protein product [Spodoptera exigua]
MGLVGKQAFELPDGKQPAPPWTLAKLRRFEWVVVRPIDPGEVVTLHLLTRVRWGAPRVLGVYRLGLQIVVTDGQISVTDTLVDERNKPVPVGKRAVELLDGKQSAPPMDTSNGTVTSLVSDDGTTRQGKIIIIPRVPQRDYGLPQTGP